MNKTRVLQALFALLLGVAFIVGAFSLGGEVQAGACRCPMIYAPVVCDNGKTYANQCLADCKNARNCVPVGIGLAE